MTGRVNSSGRCPTLKELPPGIPGKTGWPWTEESPQLPSTMPDGYQWPRISIITPSLNQGEFIEETIRSVLLQGYPDLEYIIMDGGSTDGSIEIINKYEKWIAYWVTEADKGQSHAINKGINQAKGDIIAWLNSDDLYCKNAFATVAKSMWLNSKLIRHVVFGDCYMISETSQITSKHIASHPGNFVDFVTFWRRGLGITQPTVFVSANLMKKTTLDESLHYVMDYDQWLRLRLQEPFFYIQRTIAQYRLHKDSKTIINLTSGRKPFINETKKVTRKYWGPGTYTYLKYWFGFTKWVWKQKFILKKQILCIHLSNFIIKIFGNTIYLKLKNLKNNISSCSNKI